MHATDSARRKDFYAGTMGDPCRGGYRSRAVPVLRNGNREIARGDLPDLREAGNKLQLFCVDADMQHAVEDCDRCRNGTYFTDEMFEANRGLKVLWPRQPVGDDGGFQRYDGLPAGECSSNFRCDANMVRSGWHER